MDHSWTFDSECVEGDPCEGVVCLDPPAGTCDGNVSMRWFPEGECRDGGCFYELEEEMCAGGCRGEGECFEE